MATISISWRRPQDKLLPFLMRRVVDLRIGLTTSSNLGRLLCRR
jgi:hypothetical protein